MNDYTNIINKSINLKYEEALIIDVVDDKIYKYVNNDGVFNLVKQSSYVEYFTECRNFIHEDDVKDYVESLSISKLEESNSRITLNYRMIDSKVGSFMDYVNDISLYNDNGKKIIVVLVAHGNNSTVYEKTDDTRSQIENKYNKLIDTISLSMLKIQNVVNMDNQLRTKDEYINSVLVGLTTEFPELNKSINDNSQEVYGSGKSAILIVDDDKLTCNLIAKIFSNDYEVIIANNGQEAINILGESKANNVTISCIFLDLIMPVLDGFSVLDYLNDNNYLIKLPVIIISGNYDKETRNKAYSYQIADMLEKPFNAQVIRHRIENLINLYRSSGIINEMMLEQHENLKEIIESLIRAYEVDNSMNMNMIKRYMKILTMQVSVQYPEYNINGNMIDRITESSAYYALGNYVLPKTLLNKHGEYTEVDMAMLRNANINGSAMVKYVLTNMNKGVDSKCCYEITRYYNERYDGGGYPEGLSGDAIPLASQIASLAIEYMNLINTMKPIDYSRVASLIILESGHKFNPKIVEAFKKVQTDFEAITKVGG